MIDVARDTSHSWTEMLVIWWPRHDNFEKKLAHCWLAKNHECILNGWLAASRASTHSPFCNGRLWFYCTKNLIPHSGVAMGWAGCAKSRGLPSEGAPEFQANF